MTTTTNKNFRFMNNNYLSSDNLSSSSSALANFPLSNALHSSRWKFWTPTGYFKIDATNNQLYINDGTDKTVTITNGTYATPALLATQIQTDLNAASSSWTFDHDNTAGAYAFRFAHASAHSLRFSQTANSCWDLLGFTVSTDQIISTAYEAEETRIHQYEELIYDFSGNMAVEFFGLIGPLDELLTLSSSAVVKIQGNGTNIWTSPSMDLTVSRTAGGYFQFMDAVADSSYRYIRIYIEDKQNPLGPTGLKISQLYVGDYLSFTSRNIKTGFKKQIIDPTTRSVSYSGASYFDERAKYIEITGNTLPFLLRADRDSFEEFFNLFGVSNPFFVSLDPTLCITSDLNDFTKYVVFKSSPASVNIIAEYFNVTFDVMEVF